MSQNYIKYNSTVIETNSEEEIEQLYSQGYVFTRTAKGHLEKTRSLRIDLSKFSLNSENRRILKKTASLELTFFNLPLKDYVWSIHKMGKDFYAIKFGEGTMSASKIKEMFTDMQKSNMNGAFAFKLSGQNYNSGYCLVYNNQNILHYAYPFYNLDTNLPNIGLGMMLKAILWAQQSGKKYVYLGSIKDRSSIYKLQFKGLEWWNVDNNTWSNDLDELKTLLVTNS